MDSSLSMWLIYIAAVLSLSTNTAHGTLSNIEEAKDKLGRPMRYDFRPGVQQICRCNVSRSSPNAGSVEWRVGDRSLQNWSDENNWSVIFDGPEISLTPPADTHVQTVRMFCTVDDEIVDVIDLWQKEEDNPFRRYFTSNSPFVPGYLLILTCRGTTSQVGGAWGWFTRREGRKYFLDSKEPFLVLGRDDSGVGASLSVEGQYYCTYTSGSKTSVRRTFIVTLQENAQPTDAFFFGYVVDDVTSTVEMAVETTATSTSIAPSKAGHISTEDTFSTTLHTTTAGIPKRGRANVAKQSDTVTTMQPTELTTSTQRGFTFKPKTGEILSLPTHSGIYASQVPPEGDASLRVYLYCALGGCGFLTIVLTIVLVSLCRTKKRNQKPEQQSHDDEDCNVRLNEYV